jgi:hypothetical protein
MPSTVSYRERLDAITNMRRLAKMRAEEKPLRAALPPNLVNGGPIVWRDMDAQSQADQDLLRQCRTALELLRAAYRRTPRPLLQAAITIAERAESGEFDDYLHVEEVQLAKDELETPEDEVDLPVPKFLRRWEVQWLQFLARDGVNDKNWSGKLTPDTPKEKYRLFHLFAKKVQKLLDDQDPDGLFSRHDAKVNVETLLGVINATDDTGAVTKHEFQPYDACCWLDRMKECGYLR